jgi:hypothetical protein
MEDMVAKPPLGFGFFSAAMGWWTPVSQKLKSAKLRPPLLGPHHI